MSVAEAEPKGVTAGTVTYEDLYRRWEENNWSAMGLDYSLSLRVTVCLFMSHTQRRAWRARSGNLLSLTMRCAT